MILTIGILEKAAAHFAVARKNLFAGAALLYQIRSESLYKPSYEYFGDYVEQECGISESFASKLCSVFQAYVVEGGVKPQELHDVDPEKLYLAIRLSGDFAAKVNKASLLSRSELKAELSEKNGHDCAHLTQITICASCHKRL